MIALHTFTGMSTHFDDARVTHPPTDKVAGLRTANSEGTKKSFRSILLLGQTHNRSFVVMQGRRDLSIDIGTEHVRSATAAALVLACMMDGANVSAVARRR